MIPKIEKIGSELAVKLPSTFVEQCGIDCESEVNIRVQNDHIIIEIADHPFSSRMIYWNDMDEEQSHSEMYYG